MLFDFAKHETHASIFLNEVASELGTQDLRHAGRVLTSVLHALRDHISVTESIQFISQLPLYIKAVYVEKWNPSVHSRLKSVEDFLLEVKKKSGHTAIADFKDSNTTREEVEGIFRVIRKYVSDGEIEDIKSQLPQKIGKLL